MIWRWSWWWRSSECIAWMSQANEMKRKYLMRQRDLHLLLHHGSTSSRVNNNNVLPNNNNKKKNSSTVPTYTWRRSKQSTSSGSLAGSESRVSGRRWLVGIPTADIGRLIRRVSRHRVPIRQVIGRRCRRAQRPIIAHAQSTSAAAAVRATGAEPGRWQCRRSTIWWSAKCWSWKKQKRWDLSE